MAKRKKNTGDGRSAAIVEANIAALRRIGQPISFRQGDFFFVEVANVPAEAQEEKRVNGKAIVGYGEATGHHHAVIERDASIRTLENVRWLVAPSGVDVTHNEHHTIQLPAGAYKIVQERTYNAGSIQRVRD